MKCPWTCLDHGTDCVYGHGHQFENLHRCPVGHDYRRLG